MKKLGKIKAETNAEMSLGHLMIGIEDHVSWGDKKDRIITRLLIYMNILCVPTGFPPVT